MVEVVHFSLLLVQGVSCFYSLPGVEHIPDTSGHLNTSTVGEKRYQEVCAV